MPQRPAFAPNPRGAVLLVGILIALAVAAAYSNSLRGPFVFDDLTSIGENPTLHSLGAALRPPHGGMTVEGRPVLNVSLALDYAQGGLDVLAYHRTNLLIHLGAVLLLFGLVRRTLLVSACPAPRTALVLAALTALLWGLHPLQTEAVTYVIQRAESLMGLFYLAALYAFVRARPAGDGRLPEGAPPQDRPAGTANRSAAAFGSPAWACVSVACCLLGMGTKEVMVSAPLIILLLDRTFIAGSLAQAWARRRVFYLCLAAAELVLALLVASTHSRSGSSGVGSGVGFIAYGLTQGPALVRYLRLSVWPHPLVLDYGFERTWIDHPASALPAVLAVGALAAWTLRALYRGTRPGFLLFAFFAVLAPTSLIPGSRQSLAEHRMYLALAPLIAGLVCGAGLWAAALPSPRRALGLLTGAALITGLALGALTFQRNRAYQSVEGLWTDNLAHAPGNPGPRVALGHERVLAGDLRGAYDQLRDALRLDPDYVPALANLGLVCRRLGRFEEAREVYAREVAAAPHSVQACADTAALMVQMGRLPEALDWQRRALRESPQDPVVGRALGETLLSLGRPDQARAVFSRILRTDPADAAASLDLGRALLGLGSSEAARAPLADALRAHPEWAGAHAYLGQALADQGRLEEAAAEYTRALVLEPRSAHIEDALGTTLGRLGRLEEATPHLEEAVRLEPDDVGLRMNLGTALAASGKPEEAARQFEAALALDPGNRDIAARLDTLRSR